MSPEQVRGLPIDRRSDIFSLGVVFFEMLTGKKLFLGKNDVETLEKIRKAEPPPPSMFNKSIPQEIDRIVLKALAKDREKRYQWASEFAKDLKKFSYLNNDSFSRHDMMSFMVKFFANELKEEEAKINQYKNFSKHETPTHLKERSSSKDKKGASSATIVPSVSSKGKKLLTFLVVTAIIILGYFGVSMLNQRINFATLYIDSPEQKTTVTLNKGTVYHKRCLTPCTIKKILPGTYELELKKPGFVSVKQTVVFKKAESLTKVINMYKTYEQRGMLTVKSYPDNAILYINDKKAGNVTPTVVNIPAELPIRVRVEKSGYFSVEQSVGKINANTSKEINLVLIPNHKLRNTVKNKKEINKN